MTTSVRRPLTNAPPGPSSGRGKVTAAPETGLPVSSVISTVIGRVLRDPGWCTAPSPSITRICRMATWASAAAAHRSPKAASPTDFGYKAPFRSNSAARARELSDFSQLFPMSTTVTLSGPPACLAASINLRQLSSHPPPPPPAIKDLFHARRFQHAVQAIAANEYQIALRQGHTVVVDGQR